MYLQKETIRNAGKLLMSYPDTTWSVQAKRIIKNLLFSKPLYLDRFSWPNALLAMAIEQMSLVETDIQGQLLLREYYQMWMNKKMKMVSPDDVLSGYSLLYLYEQSQNENYLKSADRIAIYLEEYKKTTSGILPYRATQPEDVYVDSIGIVVPFLARYAYVRANQRAARMATDQLVHFLDHGMDTHTGLPYHGYHAKTGVRQGIIGWGRACGWLLLGMAEYLIWIKDTQYHDIFPGEYVRIKEEFCNLVTRIERYRVKEGYFTWLITASEGPVDTSATALMAVAVLRAGQADILEKQTALNIAKRGMKAIAQSQTEGRIENCSGECEGFGRYPQDYASYPWSIGPAVAADYLYESISLEMTESIKTDKG